ncbi:hypothetical protein KDN32_03720 [Nocardioides sp. J2M5]|uniref:hypothetical protein n=1 Tax=Nocardioides palaemonis TaxID=2829810 RepID=UPI001BADADDA|nr:hypothetical protein [Nocardioides palaemonis]MBS2936850.1 hypothetical protein [Nocardioides palaemonis]
MKTLGPTLAAALLAGTVLTSAPAQAAAPKFRSCDALTRVWPNGVAKSSAAASRAVRDGYSRPASSPRARAVYWENHRNLDRDDDALPARTNATRPPGRRWRTRCVWAPIPRVMRSDGIRCDGRIDCELPQRCVELAKARLIDDVHPSASILARRLDERPGGHKRSDVAGQRRLADLQTIDR